MKELFVRALTGVPLRTRGGVKITGVSLQDDKNFPYFAGSASWGEKGNYLLSGEKHQWDIVGEWFNVESALEGRACVTRDGRKAYVNAKVAFGEMRLIGVIVNQYETVSYHPTMWTLYGEHDANQQCDLVGFWEEPALEFPHWDTLRPEIVCIAKDKSGEWWGHTAMPERSEFEWLAKGMVWSLDGLAGLPECDWENSLIVRGERQ